jgi:MSHA biogenesis protein MshJ
MKQWWTRYAEKIDAATLRERALIFFAAAFVLVALLNTTLISPNLAEQRRISAEIAQMQSESNLFQEQTQAVIRQRGQDPDVDNRKKLVDLKRQFADNEKLMQQKQDRLVPPARIADLLEDILVRNRKLELIDLKKLPVVGMNGDATAAQGAKVSSREIYRHGVEITVRGSYLDLLAYVTELEKLPSRMYWARLDFTVGTYPAVTMKILVYTLSLDKNWLVV